MKLQGINVQLFYRGWVLFSRIVLLLGCSKFNKEERDGEGNGIFQHCCFETLNACSTEKVSLYILASSTAAYYCISCLKHVGSFLVRLGSKIFHTSCEAFILSEENIMI